ncbi:gamma-glutamylcyclotransferase family protein [Neomoorella thermoacetica]|uniref:gamma-glutamylcyclotransferase family protein n=1 Tax=Neomoorella thermoacetica TaxID=1525 RepID=UPI0030CC5ABE
MPKQEKIPIFVYGTLMSIHSNRMLSLGGNGPYLGVLRGYAMYQVAPDFPGIVPEPGGKVMGEVFYIPQQAFASLDRYEGVPDLYRREEANVEMAGGGTVRAWVYIWNGKPEGQKIPFNEQPWRPKV